VLRFFAVLCCSGWNAGISKNFVNKELNNEKFCRKRFGKFSEKLGGKSNVKMGKRGGGGQYVRKS
jgi:hypothetical protein